MSQRPGAETTWHQFHVSKSSPFPSLFPHKQFGYIQTPYLEHSLVDIIPHTHPSVCCLLVYASTEPHRLALKYLFIYIQT